MEEWEKQLIKDGFKISPMLQESLKNAYESKNKELLKVGIEHLAIRAGMRIEFIQNNIEEIINF